MPTGKTELTSGASEYRGSSEITSKASVGMQSKFMVCIFREDDFFVTKQKSLSTTEWSESDEFCIKQEGSGKG